jgi:hypothetical protein
MSRVVVDSEPATHLRALLLMPHPQLESGIRMPLDDGATRKPSRIQPFPSGTAGALTPFCAPMRTHANVAFEDGSR